MEKNKDKLVKIIFSDAILIDIDFSKWDKYISLIVLADHLNSSFFKRRKPVFKIIFNEVASINFDFNHYKNYIYKNDPDKHYTWLIDRSKIRKIKGLKEIVLSQFGEKSTICIKFADYNVIEISPKILDGININWKQPFSPLARGSVEDIQKMNKKR